MNFQSKSVSGFESYTCKRQSIWKYDTLIFHQNKVIGEITFDVWKMMKATFSTENGKWLLEYGGGLSNEYSVYEKDSGEEIAILEGGFTMNYKLRLRDYPDLMLSLKGKMDWWNMRYVWADQKGKEWIILEYKFGLMGYNTSFYVNNEHVSAINPVLLAALAIYILTFRKMAASV